LDRIAAHWSLANNVEITLEANPGSVEASRFSGYRLAGVNRLSMGMQAMNDTDLRALGRLHSVDEARRAFEIARAHFDRVSFDLIYARQGQSLTDWEVELKYALEMAVDHLSLYQLTVEDGTAFGDRFARGKLPGLPTEDLAADMYELTQSLCQAHGFPAYEVSNHARPGAGSIHNRIYWKCGDYLGIGPGAHGRMTIEGRRFATETVKSPGAWLNLLRETRSGEVSRNLLSTTEQADEFILMGMRTSDGIDLARLESISGRRPSHQALKRLTDLDLLVANDNHAKATAKGVLVLNYVIEVLATDLGLID
jgi:oxygen-independent coproporphyrinogen-3 oxidase